MSVKYFFYVDEQSFQPLRIATEKEVGWYNGFAKEMEIYKKNIDRFSRVHEAFVELMTFIKEPPKNMQELENKGQTLVANFLFSFNEFLDQWEFFIVKEYGKESDFYSAYKKITGEAFDRYDEYRITYALRNYQHMDKVVDGSSLTLGEAAKLTTRRGRLLMNKKFTKLQREAIERQLEILDLVSIFTVAKEQLESIEKKLMFYTVSKEQEQQVIDALDFKKDLCQGKAGALIIGRLVDEHGNDILETAEKFFNVEKFNLIYDKEIPWGVCELLRFFKGTDYKKV